jgi:autotransporter-associated beta strand protein
MKHKFTGPLALFWATWDQPLSGSTITRTTLFNSLIAALAWLWITPTAGAITRTWDGSSSGFWNNGLNWSGNAVPVNGDDLVFPAGALNSQSTNNITGLRLNSITFSGFDYRLEGNPITLTNGVTASQISGTANIVALIITNGANVTLNSANPGALLFMLTNIVLGSTTLTNDGGGFIYLNGTLSGSGNLVKTGSGTNQMGGSVANTYTGTTTIKSGTLELNRTVANSAIPGALVIGDGTGGANADVVRLLRLRQIANTVPVTINSSGLLDMNTRDDSFGALSGNGHFELGTGGGNVVEVNYPDATSTFSGVISGAGTLYKEGSGTLTLTGNNTLTGPTIIYSDGTMDFPGGTLLVNGSQPSSAVVISNGCTLGGIGSVGPVTVAAGGTLSPGSSPGALTCSSVAFNPGSIFRVELNGSTLGSGYDNLTSLGLASLNNATLTATLGFGSALSNTFNILNKTGAIAVSGNFNGLSQGSSLNISGVPFLISYTGVTGNDVVLTQIGTVSSLAGALQVPRQSHSATLLSNGKVLIAGGIDAVAPTKSAEIYDPTTGASTETGLLQTERAYHTATLLPDGKVLVTGGVDDDFIVLNSAEIFDPATGVWTGISGMATARQVHTATLLADGKVLVAGGYGDGDAELSSAEIYDPATENWTTIAAMNTPHMYATATLLPNGNVLLAGSGAHNGPVNISEYYDRASGIWSLTPNPMHTARYSHSAILLPDGKVLVAGGRGTNAAIASTEVFDPNIGTWTEVGALNTRRYLHTSTLLPNGRALVVGGTIAFNTSSICSPELYDPSSGTWTTNGVAPLVSVRSGHTATLLSGGKVLIAGGSQGVLSGPPVGEIEQYDYPTFGNWTNTASLKTNRYFHTATLLPNGKVLVAGGTDPGAPSAELYDPTSGTWTNTSNLNSEREYHAATFLPNGKVLVTGGNNPSLGTLASAELYDLASGMWTNASIMATQRYQHTATLLPNGRVLVAGGRNSINRPPIAELYDPVSGNWTNTGSMVNSRYQHTATLLANGKVLIAGGNGSFSSTSGTELYDPTTGLFTFTTPMLVARSQHTATLLPNGKVLVVGGYTNGVITLTAELYDPPTATWTNTAPLKREHVYHTATLLPNGKVLVAGNDDGVFGAGSNAELYDPVTGAWTLTNSYPARFAHTATLLPSGKVLFAAGVGPYAGTNRADLYDTGLGFSNSWQPQITAFTPTANLGGNLVLTGSKFRGASEASGGNGSQNSESDHPVVQLIRLDNQQMIFLSCASWSSNSFVSEPLTNFPPGYALMTVFVNGIPSTSGILRIAPAPAAIFLTNPKKLPAGPFQFAFTNISSSGFTALAATNVMLPSSNWTALGGVTEIAPGQFQFSDPQATNSAQRFYRVRSP